MSGRGLVSVQRKKATTAVLALLAGIACGHLTDPALPPDAVAFVAPPVYSRWWAMMESCSGLSGSLNQIQWFATPSPLKNPENSEEYIEGYWSRASNRVVLISNDTLDGSTVRHEMLHALIRTGGHPRAMFLQKCAGLVDCGLDCVREAGPAAPVPSGTPNVAPSQLVVTSEVSPAAPGRFVDEGLGMFTILVHNPFPHSVVVVLPKPSSETFLTSYRFAITRAIGGSVTGADVVIDPEVVQFAAGETKRAVLDFAVELVPVPGINVIHGLGSRGVALPPGPYTFRGAYGGQFAPDLTVSLTP
ncbi:MAG TPA: hypothetical protein VM166_09590 [Gemmatimonadaceae bacterium]|nr:hypothetical protein [Gemmatimonadaceae bacterium]